MNLPTDPLYELLKPARLTAVVDIGANPIDGDPPYKPLLQQRLCRVIGFEPQTGALASLNARKSELETYLPYVVGDGENAQLNLCLSPGMASLLTPDPPMLGHFHNFAAWARVIESVPVSTRRLDDISEIESLDFLKIDVQGGELTCFQHGRQRLAKAVAIQTEVSFIPLYKDQPAFGSIDLELRSMGFVPHAFVAIKNWMIAPLSVPNDPAAAINQLLEADIVYVRDFTRAADMDSEQLKHLAMIAHHCYQSFDLALNCIHHLVQRQAISANAAQDYVGRLKVSTPHA